MAMAAILLVDYRHFRAVAWPLSSVSLAFLVGVALFGKIIYGAKRWLDLGFFNLQPSEMAKIAVLILGARVLARIEGRLGWFSLGKVLLVGLAPALLIVEQPDLGSALNILLILWRDDSFQGHEPWGFPHVARSGSLRAPVWMVFSA